MLQDNRDWLKVEQHVDPNDNESKLLSYLRKPNTTDRIRVTLRMNTDDLVLTIHAVKINLKFLLHLLADDKLMTASQIIPTICHHPIALFIDSRAIKGLYDNRKNNRNCFTFLETLKFLKTKFYFLTLFDDITHIESIAYLFVNSTSIDHVHFSLAVVREYNDGVESLPELLEIVFEWITRTKISSLLDCNLEYLGSIYPDFTSRLVAFVSTPYEERGLIHSQCKSAAKSYPHS